MVAWTLPPQKRGLTAHPPLTALSRQEIAEAYAAFAACEDGVPLDNDASSLTDRSYRSWFQSGCILGAPLPLSTNVAERVIPIGTYNESFGFFTRKILESHGSCTQIRAVLTRNDTGFSCQEDGCWSTRTAKVTCSGDIATVDGVSRDCSRADMRCSEQSPTGCTDRPLVRCKSGSADRCDGAVKLGCDGCGFVSYHDCAWNGGTCAETAKGAECAPPESSRSCRGMPTGCSGNELSLCVAEQPVTVSCTALGMQGCADGVSARTDGGASPYTSGVCVPGPAGGQTTGPDASAP